MSYYGIYGFSFLNSNHDVIIRPPRCCIVSRISIQAFPRNIQVIKGSICLRYHIRSSICQVSELQNLARFLGLSFQTMKQDWISRRYITHSRASPRTNVFHPLGGIAQGN
jgi:hypothetical protein